MAGTIIADKIQTENSFLTLNVGQTLVATINSSGILNSSGGTMIGANGAVSNTAITGFINGSQLAANTVANSNIQTGSIENYMRAVNLDFGLRNRIINGAMQIAQRGTSFTGLTDDGGKYTLDRWRWSENGTMDGAQAVTQDSSANTVAGFTNSLKVQTTTAKAALGTDLSCRVEQFIEGLNTYDLAWGTANARPITVSFWVRSSLTGTHGGSIRNSADDRSYPFSYTIVAADTWEQKFITIPGDTTGTWLTTNGVGLRLTFSLGAGTSLSGTANTWAAAGYQNVTGAVSVIGTLNATWYITGVQLEEGLQATSFEYRHFGKELILCQRYYFNNFTNCQGSFYSISAFVITNRFPVTMRAAPTLSLSSGSTVATDVVGGSAGTLTPFFDYTTTNSSRVSGTNSGNASIGSPVHITSSTIQASAEL